MAIGIYGSRAVPLPDAVILDPAAAIVLDAAGVSWGGVRLEQLDALYVHGFRYEDPVLPPADPVCDFSLWQAQAVIRQQAWSVLYSVWARLEDRPGGAGPRLYNPLSAELAVFDRSAPLDRLGRAGFLVPRLRVTNDDGAVTAFQRQHEGATVVWRPVTGRAAWQLFGERQHRALIGPDRPPVLLAAVVPGRLLRAYVLDGQVALVLACAPARREGLERLETMIPVADLAPERLEAIARAVTGLGLRWAVALVVDGEGGPVFYDIDPDPELADLPPALGTFLNQCLAAALRGASLPAAPPAEPAERPSLLLRRMLAIQFDIEATKYSEPA